LLSQLDLIVGRVTAIDPVTDEIWCCYVRLRAISRRGEIARVHLARVQYFSSGGTHLREEVVGVHLPARFVRGGLEAATFPLLILPPKDARRMTITFPGSGIQTAISADDLPWAAEEETPESPAIHER
jgi:hypothetical protein